MTLHIATVAVAFAIYTMCVSNRSQVLTAAPMFAYVQILMAAGTFPLLNMDNAADAAHARALTLALTTYLLISALLALALRPSAVERQSVVICRLTPALWTLLGISLLVVVVYYAAVGSSALVAGIRNAVTGSQLDVATTRLNAYASGRYLYPGYVNQFKNVLLPSLAALYLTAMSRQRPSIGKYAVGGILSLVALFGLLGTGQRGAFLMFACTSIVYLYYLSGKRLSRHSIRVASFALLVLLLATVALGRSASQWDSSTSGFAKVSLAGREFLHRVLVDQQTSSVAGFRYVYYQPVQNGAEWLASFTGILPGAGGSDLSNRIYETLFGTNRGTAPPSIWGSAYHNFGWPGVVILPALLAVVLSMVSHRAHVPRESNTLLLLGVAGVFTTLAFWASDTPTFLLNNGILVYAWLWFLGARISRHGERRAYGYTIDTRSGGDPCDTPSAPVT